MEIRRGTRIEDADMGVNCIAASPATATATATGRTFEDWGGKESEFSLRRRPVRPPGAKGMMAAEMLPVQNTARSLFIMEDLPVQDHTRLLQ